MHLSKFFHTTTGKYLMSIILGLGLASLFRKVCKDKNCLLIQAPPLDEIQNQVYKYDNKCYKYNPVAVKCDSTKKIIDFA